MQLRSASLFSVLKNWHTTLISGVLIALGLGLLISNTAYAADASIKDNVLTYGGARYEGPTQKAEGDTSTPGDIAIGDIYYFATKGDMSNRQVTYVYFTDKAAKKAKLATYKLIPPDKYELVGSISTVDIDNDGSVQVAAAPSASADEDSSNGCTKAFGGLSWIVCLASEKLGDFVDWAYDVVSDWFLVVKPLSSDQGSPIHLVWSYMRSLANVVFIVFMLIVIYSQVTSVGITNYGIKKTLPRIIIAALLVNLSYLLCALAVDASNIIGHQLHQMFMGIRDQAIASGAMDVNVNFSELFVAVGGGGALTVLGLASAGGLQGVWFLIAPVLIGAALAVLAAILTLAARQAIITLLVIVSPLAFVAYLLPNTEGWFKKWHQTGLKMLMIYPAFSLICGAAELAGWAIIASAQNLIQVVLGLAVQIIPLAFTPILGKLSGSLLGSIQSAINKPFDGLRKTAQAWGQDRHTTAKAKHVAKGIKKAGSSWKRPSTWRAPTTALANYMAYKDYSSSQGKKVAEEAAQGSHRERLSNETNTPIKNPVVRLIKGDKQRDYYQRNVATMKADAAEANLKNSMSTMSSQYGADATGRRGKKMYELTQEMSKAWTSDELEKSRATNITASDKADMAKYLNDTFTAHDAGTLSAADWAKIELAAGGRGEDGIMSIRAAALAAQDTEDKRVLEDRKVMFGKTNQSTASLVDSYKKSLLRQDAFSARALIDILASRGSFDISQLEKATAETYSLPGMNPERLYNAALPDDQQSAEYENAAKFRGILANHLGNSSSASNDLRKKASILWMWGKDNAGKTNDGRYRPDLAYDSEHGTFDLNTAGFLGVYSPTVGSPLVDRAQNVIGKILTGSGDLVKQSSGTLKRFYDMGLITRDKAVSEIAAARKDPNMADLDDDKLYYLGMSAGYAGGRDTVISAVRDEINQPR
ncbi:MAG: hypothetical protein LBL84_00775 [Candidatus Nomurabacteria bacterium]|jgi:hypothetical protein|nr:hypothetical protein [Candidatus Nomurabacteria bacterium]